MAVGVEQAVLPPAPGVPEGPFYRLGVEQYHQMIRAGILTDDDPVELLEGFLVTKMTKYPPHTLAKGLVMDALTVLLPAGWFLAAEDPVTTLESEPEPDVMVVRGARRDYLERHPGPRDVALVVEVSDSSLARDRTTKKRVYARAGIPVYWIVNLIDRRIEVYSDPSGPVENPDYRVRRDAEIAAELPLTLDGREIGRIPVRDLLP